MTEHVRARAAQWEAEYDTAAKEGISPKTAERYRELVENQIAPHLGTTPIQKLSTIDIERWRSALRATLSARTIGHAHRILSHALSDAMRHAPVVKNVAAIEGAPKVDDEEMQVVPKERMGELKTGHAAEQECRRRRVRDDLRELTAVRCAELRVHLSSTGVCGHRHSSVSRADPAIS